jgi:hypothetical protein
MKRTHEDEPQSSAVGGSGDAPAVIATVAGESSSGAPAAPRRAIDEMEMEHPVAVAADLQNQHAGQVIIVPDDDYYAGAGYDPDSIEYLIEEDRREAVPFKEEASDDSIEVLNCSDRTPLFVILFTLLLLI